MSFELTSLIAPTISGLIATASLLYTYQRNSRKDVEEKISTVKKETAEFERRITLLEQSQFTTADRKCLQNMDVKMELLWEAVKDDFPGLLKHVNTPRYDALLDKAHDDIKMLTDEETEELLGLLRAEVELAKRTEKRKQVERAAIASLYATVVKFERKGTIRVGCIGHNSDH
jgi:hypothetical protein